MFLNELFKWAKQMLKLFCFSKKKKSKKKITYLCLMRENGIEIAALIQFFLIIKS